MGRGSGMPPGLLLLLFVIGVIITALKYLWPVILAVIIIAIVVYFLNRYNEKKRVKNLQKESTLKNYNMHLQNLERYYNNSKKSLQSNPHQIFMKSIFEQLSYEIDIVKANIQKTEGTISEDEANNLINKAQEALDNYSIINKLYLDKKYLSVFYDLNNCLVSSSSEEISWAAQRPTYSHMFMWSGDVDRKETKFTKKFFNKVYPSDLCDVYAITCNKTTFYFYPDCIVESKSKYDFKIHKYTDVIFKKIPVNFAEQPGVSRNAKRIRTSYLHSRTDGGPDLRYSYNPTYDIYEYYYIFSKELPDFILEIIDEDFSNNLQQALNKMQVKVLPSNNIDEYFDGNVDSTYESDSDYSEICDDTRLKETMSSIISNYGKEVILEKRFIYMLDDYKVFEEIPYFINIIKIVQNDEALSEFINQGSWNDTCLSIVSSLSQKYGLREDAVLKVLKIINSAI